MTFPITNVSDLHIERGGPAFQLSQRLLERWHLPHSVDVRILGFLLITWVPLLCFAVLEGRALRPAPAESLLLDFGTYARFFLGVPLLIVAESVVGPRLTGAGLQFVQGGFVKSEDYPRNACDAWPEVSPTDNPKNQEESSQAAKCQLAAGHSPAVLDILTALATFPSHGLVPLPQCLEIKPVYLSSG